MDKQTCVKILLPALITNDEQKAMTDACRKSLISFNHCVQIIEDNNKYKYAVAEVWETFFNNFRGKDYDYLMITANDTEMDCNAIDYAVKCLDEHPEAGVITFHVTRDLNEFKKGYGQSSYTGELTPNYSDMDPACFIIKKGVIEKVGKVDFQFPCEFVERDYWRRCKLVGFDWIELKDVLCYHPPYAGTIGNDGPRLQKALRKYIQKWGGDAGKEVYLRPYNDLSLPISYTKQDGTRSL